MYLKIEITDENVEKITELRKNGVNLTEYVNFLIKKRVYSPSFSSNNKLTINGGTTLGISFS